MDDSITERDFSCKRDGLTIRGKEFFVKGDKLPAIIFSHGFGGNSEQLDNYCKAFASWGYATYSFDFCGGSAYDQGKSDGSSTEMTVLTECEDLSAVMDYVRGLPYIDPNRVTLIGFSQGGFVSALVAAKCGHEVESLVSVYPALCIPDDARKGALANSSYDVEHVPELIDCGMMVISKAFHEAVVHMNPFDEIIPYKGPVLIIHGTEDSVVHYNYAVRAQESYEPGQCHLQLVKGAGHQLNEEQTSSSMISIQQFLKGNKEVLTIDVQITGSDVRKEEGSAKQIAVYFTGHSESPYFKGVILPGAVDIQDYWEDNLVSLRATYTLEGTDRNGETCQVHIVNRSVNGEWKPTVTTDSQALAFLNHAHLTASLEGFTDGLTVRIFSKVE